MTQLQAKTLVDKLLSIDTIRIKNRDVVENKLIQMIQGGPNKLHFISGNSYVLYIYLLEEWIELDFDIHHIIIIYIN